MVINSPPMLMRLAHHKQSYIAKDGRYGLIMMMDAPRMEGTSVPIMMLGSTANGWWYHREDESMRYP